MFDKMLKKRGSAPAAALLFNKISLAHYIVSKVGGTYIEQSYRGSDDDGSMGDMESDGDTLRIHSDKVAMVDCNSRRVRLRQVTVYEGASELFSSLLAMAEGSWEDNNGGYGTITLSARSLSIDLEHSAYILETEDRSYAF